MDRAQSPPATTGWRPSWRWSAHRRHRTKMECLEKGCVMRAAWYERQGPAKDVLRVGEIPDPEPGPGEVRVQVQLSGVNPGDTKKRSGWLGNAMSFPRIVPHSDGSGVIDAVGEWVD